MATDVARAQAAVRSDIILTRLATAAADLELIRGMLVDPEERRTLDRILGRLEALIADLRERATPDPGHLEVDQATSFGDPTP